MNSHFLWLKEMAETDSISSSYDEIECKMRDVCGG